MQFDIEKSIEILSRTPQVLTNLLSGVSEDWIHGNEGEDTWSPYEVIGHLIHGEKTDWLPRAQIILSDATDKTFVPFDRFAQQQTSGTSTIDALLSEFRQLRTENLVLLKSLSIGEAELNMTGIHPDLGTATLRELLSTWTVHDLGHIAQISRVMAKQYQSQVGPWKAYLGILKG